jgi:hypothetical protein
LLLALALGAADAARELGASGPAGRSLLQTATDCDRSIKHCSQCRYQFFRGTVTKAICTQCQPGYSVRASGRSCESPRARAPAGLPPGPGIARKGPWGSERPGAGSAARACAYPAA